MSGERALTNIDEPLYLYDNVRSNSPQKFMKQRKFSNPSQKNIYIGEPSQIFELRDSSRGLKKLSSRRISKVSENSGDAVGVIFPAKLHSDRKIYKINDPVLRKNYNLSVSKTQKEFDYYRGKMD